MRMAICLQILAMLYKKV